jgi:hypothetical protein
MGDLMDLTAFRNDLHRLVDELIDMHLGGAAEPADYLRSTCLGPREGWSYRWPNGDTEHYDPATEYQVEGDLGRAEVLVGRTTREAWGRERGRVVVFGKPHGGSSYYPWSEFVETDNGDYAAKLTDPKDPRKSLRDKNKVPPRLAHAEVRRNDELFRSIRSGPALRLVVPADGDQAMIEYAYLVASQRGLR